MTSVISVKTKDGERVKALRLDALRLPIHICLGHYEAATQEELNDHIADLHAELARRAEAEDPGNA